jgi:hypothetical protein
VEFDICTELTCLKVINGGEPLCGAAKREQKINKKQKIPKLPRTPAQATLKKEYNIYTF